MIRWMIGGLLGCGLLFSCTGKQSDAVARAYGNYLYEKDLIGIVPADVSGRDSVKLVYAYIEQWLQQQALLQHAQRNVKVDKERIDRQVENYRNGLVVYEYEQELVAQKLDTMVQDVEIQAYYDAREELFVLKQPILKTSYIQLRDDAPEVDRVKRMMLSPSLTDLEVLRQYCAKYALSYALRDTTWHPVDQLAERIPIRKIREDNYRQRNRIFEIVSDNDLYLIVLHDSKFKDSRSPLELERAHIRNLILNRRKTALISDMQKHIVDDARNRNNIERYN